LPYTHPEHAFAASVMKGNDDHEELINITFDSMLADENKASAAITQLQKDHDKATKLFSALTDMDGSKTARTTHNGECSSSNDILQFLQEHNPVQAKLFEDTLMANLEAHLLQVPVLPPKAKGGITATMELLLASYHDLDNGTKKSLLNNAISTNNEEIQQWLLTLVKPLEAPWLN
jgi:hypothetical protein